MGSAITSMFLFAPSLTLIKTYQMNLQHTKGAKPSGTKQGQYGGELFLLPLRPSRRLIRATAAHGDDFHANLPKAAFKNAIFLRFFVSLICIMYCSIGEGLETACPIGSGFGPVILRYSS